MEAENPTESTPPPKLTRHFFNQEIDAAKETVLQAAHASEQCSNYLKGNIRSILDSECAALKHAVKKAIRGKYSASDNISRICSGVSRILQPLFINEHFKFLHWTMLREYVRIKTLVEGQQGLACKVQLLPRNWEQKLQDQRINNLDIAERCFQVGNFPTTVSLLRRQISIMLLQRVLSNDDQRALYLIARLVGIELWEQSEWDSLRQQLIDRGMLTAEHLAILAAEQRAGYESVREHLENVPMHSAYVRGNSVGERIVHPAPINSNAARILHNVEIRSEHDKQ